MTTKKESCPFAVGDNVIYRPSARGLDLDVMSSSSEKLTPGKEYKIKEIQKGGYILVEGYNHPGGGIYWSEFQPSGC